MIREYHHFGILTQGKFQSLPFQASETIVCSSPVLMFPPSTLFTKENLVRGSALVKHWNPETPFVDWLVNYDQPVIFRNTIVDRWPARSRTLAYCRTPYFVHWPHHVHIIVPKPRHACPSVTLSNHLPLFASFFILDRFLFPFRESLSYSYSCSLCPSFP
jgi:hypothetical protein